MTNEIKLYPLTVEGRREHYQDRLLEIAREVFADDLQEIDERRMGSSLELIRQFVREKLELIDVEQRQQQLNSVREILNAAGLPVKRTAYDTSEYVLDAEEFSEDAPEDKPKDKPRFKCAKNRDGSYNVVDSEEHTAVFKNIDSLRLAQIMLSMHMLSDTQGQLDTMGVENA